MKTASSVVTIGLLVFICHGQVLPGLPKKEVHCPDENPTTGFYRNHTYGFSIRIPRGLKGFWNSTACVKDKDYCVCMGDHGRHIPINAGAYLEVTAGPSNYETSRETLDEEINFRLRTHQEKQEAAEILIRATSRLANNRAIRLLLRYKDAKTRAVMLEDSIICASPGGGLYSVYLITPQSQYTKNRTPFFQVMRSWRFRPGQ